MHNTIAKRSKLIEWQKENGYTSKYVAEKLGLKPIQYAHLKSGRRNVTLGIYEKLIKEFHVGYSEGMKLLERDNERNNEVL